MENQGGACGAAGRRQRPAPALGARPARAGPDRGNATDQAGASTRSTVELEAELPVARG
jgi:hypothetical protein